MFASQCTSTVRELAGAMTTTPVAVGDNVDVLRRALEVEPDLESGLCLEVPTHSFSASANSHRLARSCPGNAFTEYWRSALSDAIQLSNAVIDLYFVVMTLSSMYGSLSSFILHPEVVDPLQSLHKPTSLMTSSACRRSSSMSMSSFQMITLLSKVTSCKSRRSGPSTSSPILTMYFLRSPQQTSSNRHSCLTP